MLPVAIFGIDGFVQIYQWPLSLILLLVPQQLHSRILETTQNTLETAQVQNIAIEQQPANNCSEHLTNWIVESQQPSWQQVLQTPFTFTPENVVYSWVNSQIFFHSEMISVVIIMTEELWDVNRSSIWILISFPLTAIDILQFLKARSDDKFSGSRTLPVRLLPGRDETSTLSGLQNQLSLKFSGLKLNRLHLALLTKNCAGYHIFYTRELKILHCLVSLKNTWLQLQRIVETDEAHPLCLTH